MDQLNKSAALHDWLQQQGHALTWPKADQVALYCVAVVLAFMLSAYALPESEATVYLRTQIALWGNLALFAVVFLATLGIIAPTVGRLFGIGAAEFVASWKETRAELAVGETRQAIEAGEPEDWTYVKGMSPFLTPDEERAIRSYPHLSLSLNTGGKVKACLAAGMGSDEIRLALKITDTRLVGRYISCINNPQKWINATSPIELEK